MCCSEPDSQAKRRALGLKIINYLDPLGGGGGGGGVKGLNTYKETQASTKESVLGPCKSSLYIHGFVTIMLVHSCSLWHEKAG